MLVAVCLLLVASPACEEIEEGQATDTCVIVHVFAEVDEPVPSFASFADCDAFPDPTVHFEAFDPADLSFAEEFHLSSFEEGPPARCRWNGSAPALRVDHGTYRVVLDGLAPGAPPWTTACSVEFTHACPFESDLETVHDLTFHYGREGCCFDGEPVGMPVSPGEVGCPPEAPGLAPPG